MSIKTVLSVLSGLQCEQDLKQAAEFCQSREAHLTALLMAISPSSYISEYEVYSDSWFEEQRKFADDLEKSTAAARAYLAGTGLSHDVSNAMLEIAWVEDEIAERALYSDLVLIGRQAALDGDLRQRALGGGLFHSPTPILINRTQKPVASTFGTVLIAWDSSDAASRAVREALDFLKAAAKVSITLVDPLAAPSVNGEEPGADIARFLARHGVNVEVDRIASGGRRIDETLLQHALDVNADLVVMGAYKHSRLQERLFGGVTRSMIETADVPLFLSH